MDEHQIQNALTFQSPEELREWLENNHGTEDELWIKVFKKHTRIPSVTWGEIVLETLCWGWIDGVKKSLGEEAYVQRITPRKEQSAWSKKNTEHVERLINEGKMREPGWAQVRAAKADGRWENAYLPPSQAQVPEDFIQALDDHPTAKQFFGTLNKSSKYAITYGLTTAKKPETRQRRFDKFMNMLTQGEEPGFGFKKKPKK
ncbi:MAG: YdeI/OmpD-associated family protein [Bacteroidota bacterium]